MFYRINNELVDLSVINSVWLAHLGTIDRVDCSVIKFTVRNYGTTMHFPAMPTPQAKEEFEKFVSSLNNLKSNIKKDDKMLNDVAQDAKTFIKDNRQVIYWIAIIFLADHFFFKGAFRDKLNVLVEKAIGRAEKALDKE